MEALEATVAVPDLPIDARTFRLDIHNVARRKISRGVAPIYPRRNTYLLRVTEARGSLDLRLISSAFDG